jgi:LysR family transcriptional regulator, hydrogen peroxide-inducible genes activator
MNLQQLEYIIALDKLKNFSKAAETCFITQATLSTMVKKLEEELDVVIFDRKTNPIITTDCGKEIIEEAKKAVYHTQNLKEMSSLIKGKTEGELKIGIIPTIANSLLKRIIPELILKYPKLKLVISEITTSNIVNQIKSGLLDVGIVSTPLNLPEIEEEILYYEKLMVYGKNNKEKNYLIPEEISKEKIWLLEEGNCLRNQVVNLCQLIPKELDHNLFFQPNTFETLLGIVDTLEGLTLIPELYFLDLTNDKKNKVSDFQSPFPVREVSVIFHRPYAKLRLITSLINEIKEKINPILATSHLKNSEMIIAKL